MTLTIVSKVFTSCDEVPINDFYYLELPLF